MRPWYPVSSMQRLKTRVRVRWAWLPPFEAVLMQEKPRKWAILKRDPRTGQNEVIWLPPRVQKTGFLRWQTSGETVRVSDDWLESRGWGPEPDAWQPIGAWADPLPDPLPTREVKDELRMVRIGKVDFDAVAAAAEMERDREEARNRKDEYREAVSLPWWRDGSRIKYERRGEVTREMAEGRVMRAVSWCGAGQDLSRGTLAMSQFLAETAAMTMAQAEAEQELLARRAVRFEPLTQDHDDFLTAMAWFTKLNGSRGMNIMKPWRLSRNQEVLLWRALAVPLSFADIGKRLGVRWDRARDIYAAAIDRIHQIANAPARIDWLIADLRQRNRAARRTA